MGFDKNICVGRTLNVDISSKFWEILRETLGKYRILDGRYVGSKWQNRLA